jgi:hypothetical protein
MAILAILGPTCLAYAAMTLEHERISMWIVGPAFTASAGLLAGALVWLFDRAWDEDPP